MAIRVNFLNFEIQINREFKCCNDSSLFGDRHSVIGLFVGVAVQFSFLFCHSTLITFCEPVFLLLRLLV